MARYAILACGLLLVTTFVAAAPSEEDAQPVETSGQPRFLDDLFAELGNIKMESFSSQGGSIIKKVQSIQGGGASQIIKTEITQSSSFPRYKRGLFDGIEGLVEGFENKVGVVKDRLTGAAADTYNLAAEAKNKLKDRL